MKTPTVLVLTQYFLAPSEVFMYRQVAGMKRLRVDVAAYRRLWADVYPTEHFHELGSTSRPVRAVDAALRRLGLLDSHDALEYDRRFRRVLKGVRPDVILCHGGWAAARLVGELERARVPVVVSFWGSDVNAAGRDGVYLKRLSRVFARGDHFVFDSAYLLREGLALGCPGDRSTVNYLGADLPDSPRSRPRAAGPAPFELLCIARLTPMKGIPVLIEAMRLLKARGVPVRLTSIGGGELRGEVEAMVENLGLRDCVRLLGALPSTEAMAHLERSDALVLSSVRCGDGQEEAFGVALIEAGARGVPVIGSRIGGVPEIIEHGRTGLLVPEKDPGALADAIERLADDPQAAAAMGAAGRRRVAEHFEIGRQNRSVEDLLLSCVGSGRLMTT